MKRPAGGFFSLPKDCKDRRQASQNGGFPVREQLNQRSSCLAHWCVACWLSHMLTCLLWMNLVSYRNWIAILYSFLWSSTLPCYAVKHVTCVRLKWTIPLGNHVKQWSLLLKALKHNKDISRFRNWWREYAHTEDRCLLKSIVLPIDPGPIILPQIPSHSTHQCSSGIWAL